MSSLNPEWARGIDVSNNNGTIDWSKVAQSGVTFVFAKATEGATWHDPTFASNVHGAKAASLIVGAYCFARFGTSAPEAEADALIQAVESVGGVDLPLVLDLEDDAGKTPEELTDCVLRWAARVEQKTGRKPILYVSPAFAKEHLDCAKLADLTLWIAHYDVPTPDVPQPWKGWTFWQCTSDGQVPGITGKVDCDLFSGTAEELRALCSTRIVTSRSGSQQSRPVPTQHRTLYPDASGSDVALCQLLLYRAGLHPGPIDGAYGQRTRDAIRAFQAAQKIQVDGVCGPVTWSRLEQARQVPRPTLRRGDKGQDVQDLQYLLAYHKTNPGVADGIFGLQTEGAVKVFQRANRLTVDGIVGPQTWGALLRV